MKFVQKIPKIEKITPVYAVAVVMIYAWSMPRFFWRLTSWLYFSSVGEVAVIFSYMMVVNLIESLLVIFVPIALSVVLPGKWFLDRFVTKGTLFISLSLGYLMYFNSRLYYQSPFPLDLVYKTPIIIAVLFVLVFLIDWSGILDKILIDLSDRMIIFLYISIPASLISVLVVIIRNIL